MEYVHIFLVLSFVVEDQKYGRNWSRKDRLALLTALESQRMMFKSFDVSEKAGCCHKSEVLAAFTAGFFYNGNFKHRKLYKVNSFLGRLFCLFKLQRIVTGRYLVNFAVCCWKFKGGHP